MLPDVTYVTAMDGNDMYTAMAVQGLDKNQDGVYSKEELAELAQVNMDGLKEFDFFTYARVKETPVKLAAICLLAGFAVTGCASKKSLPNNASELGLNGAVAGSSQDFTVNVGDRIFFDTDSSAIRADAQQTLARQAQWLNQYPQYSITIEGHADERGTREYNIALGARRAAATRDFLASRGVNASRIRTISYGKERPVATCDDISCWSQNRRAVTALGGGSCSNRHP